MSSPEPERMLSAALRAQAAGGATPQASAEAPAPPPPPPKRKPLPVIRVLLFAAFLGAVSGAIVRVLESL